MGLLIQVIIISLASTFLVLCLLHAGEGTHHAYGLAYPGCFDHISMRLAYDNTKVKVLTFSSFMEFYYDSG
jgi:hypothetical protein